MTQTKYINELKKKYYNTRNEYFSVDKYYKLNDINFYIHENNNNLKIFYII